MLDSLSPEQRQVVETWGQGMAVLAGAGSGKTTTLVVKCGELLRRNPQARFAAVSFTERSTGDLKAKLSERLGQVESIHGAGHWVMTIHGLCSAVLREFPREAGFEGDETMLSEPESRALWERATEVLWSDDLPDGVRQAADRLIEREDRAGLSSLLDRVRALFSFGALERLESSSQADTRALHLVSTFALERYARLKRRRATLDFDDLERGADRALEHAHVRENFHRRFDLVLIDEFQDTNPTQARLLKKFSRPDLSNLCVVGDPKQSIYRFRDADVGVFEDFCSRMPVRISLTWNFRSRPGVIDYSNDVCAGIFPASQLSYEPLVAKREADPKCEPVVRLDVANPSELGRWLANEITRGVPLEDFALLLRRIRGNEKWLKALTAAGIPIAVSSGGLFWDDPRTRELVALLRWWDQPGNSLSAVTFLRAPWVGVPDAEIDAWIRKDSTLQEPFFTALHPLAQALAPLRGKVVRPGEVLMALFNIDDSAALEDEIGGPALGLWHRVEELATRGMDFSAIAQELARAVSEGRRERDVPPPRNAGQLRVLTLHGSKGLEFPHVILIDFGKKPRAGESPLLFWDRERGVHLGARTSEGDRDRKDALELEWRALEKLKSVAESKRLFYVALTRARERLVLVCPELPEGELEKTDRESSASEDYWRAWIELANAQPVSVAVPDAEAVAPKPMAAPGRARSRRERTGEFPAFRRPRHSVTEWNLLSRCPRAYEWTFIRPRVVAAGIPEARIFTGDRVETLEEGLLTQRELGTRVHACLETGDFEALRGLEREAGSSRFQADAVMSWALSSPWMAPSQPERSREVWTELEFEAPAGDGEVLAGSMDRVVCEMTPEGPRYDIIDFKVTEQAKSVDQLLEAYCTQIDLYAYALAKLDPRAERSGAISGHLVNISVGLVQVVPTPIDLERAVRLAPEASAIVNGRAGSPRPGPLCMFCEFRARCPEARQSSDA